LRYFRNGAFRRDDAVLEEDGAVAQGQREGDIVRHHDFGLG
jgi:hypothetical protein